MLDEAAECISGILEGLSSNSNLMDSIANGSRKESGAIAEMAAAVRQMDEMIQHNAALFEETNAAIEQTEGEAGELDRIVEIFMVADAAPLHQATRSARQAG